MEKFLFVSTNGQATEITGILKIGRSKTNGLVLMDPLVSRHHATIYFEGDSMIIRDEQSVNGTIVNGSKIYDPVVIRDLDTIQIGDEVFTIKAPLSEARTVRASGEEFPQGEFPLSGGEDEVLTNDGPFLGESFRTFIQDRRQLIIIVGASFLVLCVCCLVGYIVSSNLDLLQF